MSNVFHESQSKKYDAQEMEREEKERSMLFKTQGAGQEADPIAAREKFAVNLRKERKKKILHESRKRTLGYLKNEIAPIKSVFNIEMSASNGADSK